MKRCLCPVQFQGIQWYLFMSWHVRALWTLFLPPYFPINLHYAPYERSPVEKWPSSCKFRWENLSTVYRQPGFFLRRVNSAALIIPFFGVMEQLSCSPGSRWSGRCHSAGQELEAVGSLRQCGGRSLWHGNPQCPRAWMHRCFFVQLRLWEPLQGNITEVFCLDKKVVLWSRICSLKRVALWAKFMSGV